MFIARKFDKIISEVHVATLWEQKKAKQAKAREQSRKIGAVAGTAVQLGQKVVLKGGTVPGSGLAAVIELVGTIGVAAWSFFTQKKQTKKRQRRLKIEGATQTAISDILQEIEDTGLAIIEQHGINPMTSDFEKVLYDTLFQRIGYRGNCNATIWEPGSKPGPNRPVRFYITGGGRKFSAGMGRPLPPNLQTFWYVQCKNAKDKWINTYTQLLIQQGRLRELEDFQASLKKGQTIIRIVFIIIFLVLGIFAFVSSTKIKV